MDTSANCGHVFPNKSTLFDEKTQLVNSQAGSFLIASVIHHGYAIDGASHIEGSNRGNNPHSDNRNDGAYEVVWIEAFGGPTADQQSHNQQWNYNSHRWPSKLALVKGSGARHKAIAVPREKMPAMMMRMEIMISGIVI